MVGQFGFDRLDKFRHQGRHYNRRRFPAIVHGGFPSIQRPIFAIRLIPRHLTLKPLPTPQPFVKLVTGVPRKRACLSTTWPDFAIFLKKLQAS
jgi:hypothetical protein